MSSSDEPISQLWEQCCQILMAKLTPQIFNMFLGNGNVFPLALDHRALSLGLPPNAFLAWVEGNYRQDIEQAVQAVTGKPLKVTMRLLSPEEYSQLAPVDVATSESPAPTVTAAPSVAPVVVKDHRLENLNSNYTFESFVVGPNTSFAYNVCLQVANAPGQGRNPLFIHGPSGLGKTHLMQAIAREVCRKNAKAVVEYLTSEQFGNQYVEACMSIKSKSHGNMTNFRQHFRNVDVLLIDDVQFFAGKTGMQEEFFHTFEELYNNHKQIVLASDRTPEELAGLSRRLVSRFEWGLMVDITPPDLTTRVAILNEKQSHSSVKLPLNILEYLASRVRSNVRNLESCLVTLQTYLALPGDSGQPAVVTNALVDELCSSHFEQDAAIQLTIARVQEAVAHHFDVRIQDLRGKMRQGEITLARQVAMYLSRELTGKSLPVIATAFDKTHPTVIHALRIIEKKAADSDEFRQVLADISRKLTSENR